MDEKRHLQQWRRKPNPETRAAHKKEFRRQVLLPLGLFVLLFAAAAWAAVYFQIGSVERWSQIAVIALAVLSMVVGFVLLVVFVGLVYVISRLLKLLPEYTRIAQDGIKTIKRQVETGANITVKPVIKVQSFLAVIDALFGRR